MRDLFPPPSTPNSLSSSGVAAIAITVSPDELADLTDTPVKSLQCSWLDQKGWIYTLSRMGNPKVLRSYAEQKLGMASAHPGDSEPDFTAWTTA
uniref:DUF4224 domain-containing protein n=1 Tax=Aromatoleum anaerobium TaxID=182180 RepID=A0ABX1PN56_9RHOO